MNGKTLVRIGAAAFVGMAATVAAIEMNDRDRGRDRASEAPNVRANPASVAGDPLHRLLVRCQTLGASATRDPVCLKTWASNRRRFLGSGTSHDIDPSGSAYTGPFVPSASMKARLASLDMGTADPIPDEAIGKGAIPTPSAPREDRWC